MVQLKGMLTAPLLSARDAYKTLQIPDTTQKRKKKNKVKQIQVTSDQNGNKKRKKIKRNIKSSSLLNEANDVKNTKPKKKKRSVPKENEACTSVDESGDFASTVKQKRTNIFKKAEIEDKSDESHSSPIKKVKKRKLTQKKNEIAKKRKSENLVVKNGNKQKVIAKRRNIEDSEQLGAETFKWILGQLPMKEFFSTYWEKKELLIKAEEGNKFKGILSTFDIDKILRRNHLLFTKNIDITSYRDGKRETHTPEGRALAPLVWDFYNSGCSIRMLNPQTFHRPVWKMLASLQEFFNSFCGANVYLTPPGTQGFAPHWDDIEAFIIQLEGKKRWRVYRPRNAAEILARESSPNFGPGSGLGEPVIDCILSPGDLLYFPRGFIHQAEALNETHSLHITISTYQKNSWADLLETLLPAALSAATAEDVEFRRGLPREYLNHAGIVHSNKQRDTIQAHIVSKVKDLVGRMMNYASIDEAVDQMGKKFIHDSLPPVLSEEELRKSVFEGGERWSIEQNAVENRVELAPDSSIRLLRKGCVRLLVEEKTVRLFHTLENSREYHAEEPKYVEIAPEMAFAVEALIRAYPRYTTVEELPLKLLEDKIALAIGLWEKGLVTTLEELISLDDSGEVSLEIK